MFDLAGRLGWQSIGEGLQHITAIELAEWEAYYQIEPFGEKRMDLRFAMLMALLANLLTYSENGKKREYKPEDFMPDFERAYLDTEDEKPTQSWQEQLSFLQSLAKRQANK